jgi:hypothetical protein
MAPQTATGDTTSICVLCNRTFGNNKALKQHEEDSPKHAPFDCKACNRSFSSQTALSQHQNDSPVHQKPRKDSVTTSVTSAPFAHYVPLLFSTTPHFRSTIYNNQRSHHSTTESSARAKSTLHLPATPLEDRLRALTIPDVHTIVAPPETDQAHIFTRQEETRTSFTFPELHQRISEAVAPGIASTWFNNNMDAYFEEDYKTCVMGKFICDNNRCRKNGWSSKLVAIWIRRYPRSGYNAIVYNQHCKSCGRLGIFKLDEESYVDRIAYRLKKWAGVPVEKPPFHIKIHVRHESDLCEGCKVGNCPWIEC